LPENISKQLEKNLRFPYRLSASYQYLILGECLMSNAIQSSVQALCTSVYEKMPSRQQVTNNIYKVAIPAIALFAMALAQQAGADVGTQYMICVISCSPDCPSYFGDKCFSVDPSSPVMLCKDVVNL